MKIAIANSNVIIGYADTEDDRIIRMFESLGLSFRIDDNDIEKITAFLPAVLVLQHIYWIVSFMPAKNSVFRY